MNGTLSGGGGGGGKFMNGYISGRGQGDKSMNDCIVRWGGGRPIHEQLHCQVGEQIHEWHHFS